MSIIITRGGEEAHKLEPKPIVSEDYLQQYLQKNPECLPVDEIQEDLSLLVLSREYPTTSGPIDILGVDQEGNIYIIETKLYKNPDKRLVIAQVLDYGAALWKGFSGKEAFLDNLRDRTSKHVNITLGLALQGAFEMDESELDGFFDRLASNAESGAFRFIVLMDHLQDRLKNLIAFVNENSRFTVYGVELEFYQFEDYEIAIPRLYGAETRKEVGSSQRRNWDETSFFVDAREKLGADQVQAIRKLYAFVEKRADVLSWGSGVTKGSFTARFRNLNGRSLFSVYSDGRLTLRFGQLTKYGVGKDVVAAFGRIASEELGFSLPEEFETSYPQYDAEAWTEKVDQLISALGKFIDQYG